MHEIFKGISNVDTSLDDIIVLGRNWKEYDEALQEVLKRAEMSNLKSNKERVILGWHNLHFLVIYFQ